jgi:hypothetical protein
LWAAIAATQRDSSRDGWTASAGKRYNDTRAGWDPTRFHRANQGIRRANGVSPFPFSNASTASDPGTHSSGIAPALLHPQFEVRNARINHVRKLRKGLRAESDRHGSHRKVNAAAIPTIEDPAKPRCLGKAHALMRRVTRHGFDSSEPISNFGPHYLEAGSRSQDENENRFHLKTVFEIE